MRLERHRERGQRRKRDREKGRVGYPRNRNPWPSSLIRAGIRDEKSALKSGESWTERNKENARESERDGERAT